MSQIKIFKNAVGHSNMPDNEYRNIDAISQTTVKQLIVSPAHYKYQKEHPDKETSAMSLGTATHLAAFQPSLFDSSVVMSPKFDMRKTVDKEAYAEFKEKNAGKIALQPDEYEKCIGMAEALRSNPQFMSLIEEGEAEYSVTAETINEGIKVKGRFDWIDFKNRVIVDLKTIGELASFYAIKKTILKRGYHIQDAFYDQLVTTLINDADFRFIFAFCESADPHGIRFVELNKATLRFEVCPLIIKTFADYKRCIDTGVYHSYSNEINYIDIN